MGHLLDVRDVHTDFLLPTGPVHALQGVNFHVDTGEIVGLVGESGSGKSVTAASILGLVKTPGRIVRGQIRFEDRDLVTAPEHVLRDLRGRHIALIVQSPRAALNPLVRIGDQMVDVYRSHVRISRRAAWAASLDMLSAVDISDVEQRARAYPHQLSGGTAQRVLIAIALLCQPKLLLADEPTTSLDATIQVQILNLLSELIHGVGSAALLITHDLGVAAHYCQRLLVMHAGRIVEDGPVDQVFAHPQHPYTERLIAASSLVGGDRQVEGLLGAPA
jgi:ABC-type dipeptide/oligopeptide/nickel transport system ATPase component